MGSNDTMVRLNFRALHKAQYIIFREWGMIWLYMWGVFSGVVWCRSVFYSEVHDIIIENFIALNFKLTTVSFDTSLQLVI